MSGFVIPSPKQQFFDDNGDPLAGGKLYSYEAGTSTPLATYTSEALTTPNANPVILDAAGRATIFIPDDTLYKFTLKTSADVEIYTVDNVSVPTAQPAPTPVVVPTGAMLEWPAAAAPTGYLLCDGSAVSRTTFAALFAVVGTVYGAGDGSTTFNIPDMRQKFPLGKAAAGTGSSLAGQGGAIDHTHTGPSHTHDTTIPRDGYGSETNVTSVAGRLQVGNGVASNLIQATLTPTATSAAAGTGATGTQNPPYLVVNYIIRTGN